MALSSKAKHALHKIVVPSPKLDFAESIDLFSEISPGIYMGGTQDADSRLATNTSADGFANHNRPSFYDDKKFQTVVTLYLWANPTGDGVKELRLPFRDDYQINFDVNAMFSIVRDAHYDWSSGKRVLVRCQAGQNRSGLVMALILMRDGKSADEAIEVVRTHRNFGALNNPAFVDWLKAEPLDFWRQD